MDIAKDTTIFSLRDGIKIFGEPVISDDWIIQRVTLKANTYQPWKKGDQIGKSTGQIITKGGVQFLEVECIACLWTRKNILANWRITNVLGYVPITSLKSDVYFFQKDGTPIKFPDTNVPENAAAGDADKDGSGNESSYTGILWVLVFVLAMVAGYKALNRKRKN